MWKKNSSLVRESVLCYDKLIEKRDVYCRDRKSSGKRKGGFYG